jgi:hypothetical protein
VKLRPDFRPVAEITIDDGEAELLNHLVSYDIARVFVEKFSHKYTYEQIRDVLGQVRRQTEEILAAKKRAVDALRTSA